MIGCFLKTLPVLVIDCQTTGNSPEKSHLLEIGWLPFRPTRRFDKRTLSPKTLIIAQPEGTVLAPRIQKLTGIREDHLVNAVKPKAAWQLLKETARQVATASGLPFCPAVIHYARFELSFLEQIRRRVDGAQCLPLETICTHAISRRLLPELPRKGLRAVAGYFGHSVPEPKRCRSHLIATAYVWHRLLAEMEGRVGIVSLADLKSWVKTATPPATRAKEYPMPGEKLQNIPKKPGVYRFMRSNGDLLYIGKATSLRQRVQSYFHRSRRHAEHLLEMLTQAVDLEVTATPTALEAALLESDEIKQHHPPYNVALRSKGREPVFVSRDFRQFAISPNATCRLGPVTSQKQFRAVRLLSKSLQAGCPAAEDIDVSAMMAIPESYGPDDTCLQEGLDLFRLKYAKMLHHRDHIRSLLKIGRISWLERKKEKEAVSLENAAAENPVGDGPDEFTWDPEAVLHLLEALLRHCGHQLRRARWFAVLSESSLVWQHSNDPRLANLLVLHKGRPVDRDCIRIDDVPSVPSLHRSPMKDRQQHMDLPTYDRLRILTTEIRRLLAQNRFLAIHFGVSSWKKLNPRLLDLL